jgi:3-phosphoshikimate 1-carboxyvinyltransferase
MFSFNGNVIASKSWLNRTLIINYFNPLISVEAKSDSDDVVSLANAIDQLKNNKNNFDLGLGGTSFRFFSFLVSRQKGEWYLKANERLLQRPQQEIVSVLQQLGVSAELNKEGLKIKSDGWKNLNTKVTISNNESSQFITGLLLSCWGLDFDLEIKLTKPFNSFSYFQMTLSLLATCGMKFELTEFSEYYILRIDKNQELRNQKLNAELDVSSAFALIAAAVVSGYVQINNWNKNSIQPDMFFLDVFNKMQIKYKITGECFCIEKQNTWLPIDVDLKNAPDLFPVLSVLAALTKGVSKLTGAAQLVNKESNRILKTHELLNLVGIKSEMLADGLIIYGNTDLTEKACVFNPDHDHRMAMAAALLKLKGFNITILSPEVVNKSYPLFWQDIGLTQ